MYTWDIEKKIWCESLTQLFLPQEYKLTAVLASLVNSQSVSPVLFPRLANFHCRNLWVLIAPLREFLEKKVMEHKSLTLNRRSALKV